MKDKNKRNAIFAASVGFIVGASIVSYTLNTKGVVTVKPMQILTWKSKQTVEVFVEALGDPGNIIQDVTTGTVYASQGQAARELGLNASRISQHLHGKAPTVNGHVFEKLGKAGVA